MIQHIGKLASICKTQICIKSGGNKQCEMMLIEIIVILGRNTDSKELLAFAHHLSYLLSVFILYHVNSPFGFQFNFSRL